VVRTASVAAPPRPPAAAPDGSAPRERRIERRVERPGTRAVAGALLMTVAAVGVFVAHTTAGGEPRGTVVVADGPVRPGQELGAADLRVERVDLPDAVSGTFARSDDLVGRVALAPMGPGEVVSRSAVTDDVSSPAHEVAVVLPRDQVAVGRLKQGERVDVYVTADDTTRTVARGAQVVLIGSTEEASLTSAREVTLVVAVEDTTTVAAVVHALRTGDVTIVRSTLAAEAADAVAFDGEAGAGAAEDGATAAGAGR